jgi:hypothetical protein
MLHISVGSQPHQYFHIGTDEVPESCWAKITKDPNAIFQTYIDRATKNLTAGDFPTKQPPRKVGGQRWAR